MNNINEYKLLVSVLMTVYNRQIFLEEAIESVLNSTFKNFEFIIVDDVSNDNSLFIAKSYESKDSRIKVFCNDINLGDYPNRNRAVSLSRGNYLMFVDSDDKILPDGIEKCVNTMMEFPDCHFGILKNDEIGNKPRKMIPSESINYHFFIKPFLTMGPGGTIINRSFFNKINYYPVKYGPANDMYFNLKAACNTNTVTLPFEFLYYRRHEGQEINNKYSYLFNNYLYTKDALINLNLPLNKSEIKFLSKKNKRRFLVNLFKYLYTSGKLKQTISALKIAKFTISDALIAIFQ